MLSKNVRQIVAMEEEARGERWGKWKQLPQASSEFQPERRQAHTAVGFGGYSVFLFGGHTDQGLCPSDLWIFSCGTLKILAPLIFVLIVLLSIVEKSGWEKVKVKGTAPSPRHSHSCVIHGTSLIIFGGACEGGFLDPSLYLFDICTLYPQPAYFHSPPHSFISRYALQFEGDGRRLWRKEKQHKGDGDTLLWFIPPRCLSLEDSMMMVIPINSSFSISVISFFPLALFYLWSS